MGPAADEPHMKMWRAHRANLNLIYFFVFQ